MSSVWPCAPFEPVARLLDAAHTALVVAECTVWKLAAFHALEQRCRCPPASTIATVTAIAGFLRALRNAPCRHDLLAPAVGEALSIGVLLCVHAFLLGIY